MSAEADGRPEPQTYVEEIIRKSVAQVARREKINFPYAIVTGYGHSIERVYMKLYRGLFY